MAVHNATVSSIIAGFFVQVDYIQPVCSMKTGLCTRAKIFLHRQLVRFCCQFPSTADLISHPPVLIKEFHGRTLTRSSARLPPFSAPKHLGREGEGDTLAAKTATGGTVNASVLMHAFSGRVLCASLKRDEK